MNDLNCVHAPGIAPNNKNCHTAFGFGFQGGADTALGLGKGTAATGSGGAGLFFGSGGASAGAYASGGAMSNLGTVRGYPNQSMGTPVALGAGVGGGGGVFFSFIRAGTSFSKALTGFGVLGSVVSTVTDANAAISAYTACRIGKP